MNRIKNYEEFLNEGLLDKLKSGLGKVGSGVKSALHKSMTTDKQRTPEEGDSTSKSTIKKSDTTTKDIKGTKPVTSKIGRIIKGQNAFIDKKRGDIIFMDDVLNKDELSKVIELWKKNDKKGAASILKNFAVRERNMQFNLAVGLMMSALCLGTGACIPKLRAQTQLIDTDVSEIIPLEGIEYKDALLKFYQQLGDKFNIGTGSKFINGVASKDELFDLFDTMADKKGITTDEFLKKMFSITHDGNMDMVKQEMDYLAQCKADESIKTVGQIFSERLGQDMTGVKGFKPFGISSPENAKELQAYFNDTIGIGKDIVKTTKQFTQDIGDVRVLDKGDASIIGSAVGAGVSPSASGAIKNRKENIQKESIRVIVNFNNFIKNNN